MCTKKIDSFVKNIKIKYLVKIKFDIILFVAVASHYDWIFSCLNNYNYYHKGLFAIKKKQIEVKRIVKQYNALALLL